MSNQVMCSYCPRKAQRVGGSVIYPHRPDLHEKQFFYCAPCRAYVGCHPDGRPLGRLANAELRAAKIAAHDALDPLWRPFSAQHVAYPEERVVNKKLQRVMRKRAYAWLSVQMGTPVDDTHIGMFDVAECRRVVEVISGARIDAAGIRLWFKERQHV